MVPPVQPVAASRALWWIQIRWWRLDDWLGTVLDQPVEIHAFLLGCLVGVGVAAVAARGHLETLLSVGSVALFVGFVLFDGVLCSETAGACRRFRLEPWYFFAGVCLAYPLALGGVRTALQDRPSDEVTAALAWLAAALVLTVLGLALYSFVSPTPVHPLTGLGTVGGLVGSCLGVGAYEWVRRDDGSGPGYAETMRRVVSRERERAIFVVSYGTTLGFGYPRLYWELSAAFGRESFLLGPITWARYGLPSVGVYVSVLFLGHLGWVVARCRRRGRRLGGRRFAALVLGYLVYALCLFLATGLVVTVWDRLLF
ncbi:hypothetical protein [Halosimplex amylolyticum]|uniref:hypothetical protein n=1 Tax=Halosimplex amylolyticum TaxID=3396616 RepID=UPI003F56A57E